jgi:lipopolysaccharide heptosyltransferase I
MPPEATASGKQPRILIVRLSAIGDVVHTLPLLCALRDRFPRAMLAWVVEDRSAMLLRGHAALDELIVLPRNWLAWPSVVWQLRSRLRAMDLDLVIDAQSLTKSALAAWLSGAKRRIGFGHPWGREISRWFNTELVDTTQPHVIDRHLELLRPLGIESPAVHFDIPEQESDRAAAVNIIHAVGAEQGFGIIAPGAGWPSKLWPVDRYAAVSRYLGRQWRLPTLVVWGNRQERAWAEQIAAGSDGAAKTASAMTLRELAALARRARLFIGSDTGPLHLAAAVGTPCVGLYGPWSPDHHGPYGPQHVVLQKMTVEGSTWQKRHASGQCMEAIDVDLVCDACDQILHRSDAQAA